jgi:hypothetical protein
MAKLLLLKRSDAALVLVACCEGDCDEMAAELSERQAFTVDVVACFPTFGCIATELRTTLAEKHVMNGWFAMCVGEALRIVSYALDEAVVKGLEQECNQEAKKTTKCEAPGNEECNEEPPSAVADAVPHGNEGLEQECTEERPNKIQDEAPAHEERSQEPPSVPADDAPQECCREPPNLVADNEPPNGECCLEHPNAVADNAQPNEMRSQKPPNADEPLNEECYQEPPNIVAENPRPANTSSMDPPNDATNYDAPHGAEDESTPPSVAETAWEQSGSQAQEGDDDGEELSEPSSVCSCDSLLQRRYKEHYLTNVAASKAADECAAQCLETCPREHADTAKTIKMWLNEHFEKGIAMAVLLNYEERVLRKGRGAANQRMLLDGQGCTVRLRVPAGGLA